MKLVSTLALVLAVAATACVGNSVSPQGDNPGFDALEVGDTLRYRVLSGQQYPSQTESPYSYTSGVLVAEVVASTANGLLINEYFEVVPGDDELPWGVDDTTYEYLIDVVGDDLRIIPNGSFFQSRLFPSWGAPELPLADITNQQAQLFGWKTTLGYCECASEAYVVDGGINGATYPRLNVVVRNEGMQVDGPGATYLYSGDFGLVRSIQYSWWTGEGIGYDLIP